ncbi:sigma 54-interacting transcriptional regulator [Croceicoccus sp. F390]|uniref:Sigma 54-interacting transcriptional regulator n=1 Tax=Croceicoccus esteveae TaxID=3075597 RepID=A0ABU2ZDK9_9SPHN|nr:sigma 54-interacting transcriptional regulator [Croceicoccus sp. F390]MDT0574693.1 sigma 54-interacting transcriptional regulator [Croceicoccus sp. F390]
MLVARLCKQAEKIHAPLIRRVATVVEATPGSGTVALCDVNEELPSRRSNDRLVVFARAETPSVRVTGCRGATIHYDHAESEAAFAAGVACAAAPGAFVSADPGSLALLALAERVAKAGIPVLIDGPTGTGKEVLSRFIHDHSERSNGPFVAVNCAAMPEAMLEALLFGHQKGAFTGAANAAEGLFRAADKGTLLLDEIAEMPLALQAKLLRALQEGEILPLGATRPVRVDVRIIACANRDLPTEIAEGRFREDLFYRLNVFPLSLPALRERVTDVAPLAFAMVMRHASSTSNVPWIDAEALRKLQSHNWPGNVRELENVMRRAMLLAGDAPVILPEHICFDMSARPMARPLQAEAPEDISHPSIGGAKLSSIKRSSEARAISDALDANDGSRMATARQLGISERTLRYRLASMRDAGLSVAGAGR